MSRGTRHNAYNRARQRAYEEAEFDPNKDAKQAAAIDRSKGRLNLCSVCKEFFRSNSSKVGKHVCPSCLRKQ
jgi:formylmethanofuran dehydrogenase subunit E